MRTPTDVLRDEHVVITRALGTLCAAADRVEAGETVPDAWWRAMISWLRGFADASHHAKEETLLFPAMVERGVPSGGGPIGMMLEEHEAGRALIRAMDVEAPAVRIVNARKYAELLRLHIDKENAVLFAIAEGVLEPARQAALAAQFARLEAEQAPGTTLEGAATALDALTVALAG